MNNQSFFKQNFSAIMIISIILGIVLSSVFIYEVNNKSKIQKALDLIGIKDEHIKVENTEYGKVVILVTDFGEYQEIGYVSEPTHDEMSIFYNHIESEDAVPIIKETIESSSKDYLQVIAKRVQVHKEEFLKVYPNWHFATYPEMKIRNNLTFSANGKNTEYSMLFEISEDESVCINIDAKGISTSWSNGSRYEFDSPEVKVLMDAIKPETEFMSK
jgi:hypothetical protein